MLECIMLYSPTCHACEATIPLVRLLENEFRDFVEFRYLSVANPDIEYRLPMSWEDFIAELHYWKFSVSIDEDTELPEETKIRMKQAGMKYSPALPTFIIRDLNHPNSYKFISGGIAQASPRWEVDEVLNDLRLMFLQFIRADHRFFRPAVMASQFPEYKFRREYENPFADRGKRHE